jgi:exodeoxyribonuclease V alpha subunit
VETIKGRLEHIRFQGDNNWTVASILADHKEITIVGNLIDAELGDSLELTGDWRMHPSFGKQFNFKSYNVLVPTTAEGIIGFLVSRLHDIGRSRAVAIVQRFGAENVFDVIAKNPERLTKISGITWDRAQRIHLDYLEVTNLRDTIVFLKQFRLTDNQVSRVIEAYKDKTQEIIKRNPYQLITDIDGFGFKTVDEFALRMGIDRNGIERAKAGCIYTMQVAQNDGNTYLPIDEYKKRVSVELGINRERVDEAIQVLQKKTYIVVENNRVYNMRLYSLECTIAAMLILR